MIKLLIVMLLTSCSVENWKTVNTAGAALSISSLAVDACQTDSVARQHWDWGRQEEGFPTRMLIGGKPSAVAVDGYFTVSALVLVGVAQLIPAKYRWLAYAGIISVETYTVTTNLLNVRGLRSPCGV